MRYENRVTSWNKFVFVQDVVEGIQVCTCLLTKVQGWLGGEIGKQGYKLEQVRVQDVVEGILQHNP